MSTSVNGQKVHFHWPRLYKDHALGENLILVHEMRSAPIFILASVLFQITCLFVHLSVHYFMCPKKILTSPSFSALEGLESSQAGGTI